MSDAGFVLIYRRLLGHHAFRNDAEALAFAWMVIKASWQPVRVRYKGQSVELDRGQLAISVRDLALALDRPKGWIERLLIRLKAGTMIETSGETGVNVITICNYNEYQSNEEGSKTPRRTPRKTAAGQRQDTEQRKEQGNKKQSLDSPLPPDGLEIPEWMPADAWNAFLKMRDHIKEPPTEGALKIIIGKLEKWRAAGHDPADILNNSTENNWRGVFEPRRKPTGGKANGNGNSGGGNNPLFDVARDELGFGR